MGALKIPLEERVFSHLIIKQVEQSADRPYLSFGRSQWTFGEFFRDSQALARGLAASGLRAQVPVAILMSNRPEFMLAYWALTFLNAIVVPVNISLKGDTLAYLLRDSGVKAIISEADLLANLARLDKEQLAGIETLVVVGGAAAAEPVRAVPRTLAFEALIGEFAGGGILCAPACFDDVHVIPYTSGTTGPSKGAIVPYAQSIHTSLTCIEAVGIGRDDIIYAPLPLFHGMSSRMGAIPAMLTGARVHLAPRFSASRYWQEVTDSGATVGVTIFTIPPTLKALPPSPLDRGHKLRVMFNAHHDREFEDRFGVRVVEAYGMTEFGLPVYSPWGERREGSAGRAGTDWDVQIVDEMDRPLGAGATGEMVIRPRLPSIMMKGYLNKPAETAAATRNLWFHTGDYMRLDQDGYFFFDGRKKERIRCRGENVSSYEVESIVMQHPEVVECAVVAHPAGDGEDDVRLVAVLKDGARLSEAALADWLDTRVPKFMSPRYVEFRALLPKTESGKIEKFRVVGSDFGPRYWDRRGGGPIEGKAPASA